MNQGTSKEFSTTSNGVEIFQDMKYIFEDHLSHLVIWFQKYFQNKNIDKFASIQDPFNSIVPSKFTSTKEERFLSSIATIV